MVIRVAAIVRSAHLIPQWRLKKDLQHDDYFKSYFLNNFVDRDMSARIPDCVEGVFTGVGMLGSGDGEDNGEQPDLRTRKRRRGERD